MADPEVFGTRIKQLRLELGWSLRRAAKALGITHYRLGEIELGISRSTGHPTRPTRELAIRMAQVFELPSDYLLELAGYARLRPESTDEDVLVLDLFHALDSEHRAMAIGILKVMDTAKYGST